MVNLYRVCILHAVRIKRCMIIPYGKELTAPPLAKKVVHGSNDG